MGSIQGEIGHDIFIHTSYILGRLYNWKPLYNQGCGGLVIIILGLGLGFHVFRSMHVVFVSADCKLLLSYICLVSTQYRGLKVVITGRPPAMLTVPNM